MKSNDGDMAAASEQERCVSERELLELAAKAAGQRIDYWHSNGSPMMRGTNGVPYPWHPLADDGDALRLAVKRGLRVDIFLRRMEPYTRVWWDQDEWVEEEHRQDASRATRRAIVRAAAEIGRHAAEQPVSSEPNEQKAALPKQEQP